MEYACVAALEDGRTRCRRIVDGPFRYCWQHCEGGPVAPPPDAILVEPKINPFWFGRLRDEIFLRLVKPERERREEQRQRHIAQAIEHRRQPFALRKTQEASGTPVFGKKAAQFINISGLLEEFLVEGYLLTEIHAEPAQNPEMAVLTMNFSRHVDFIDSSLFQLMESELGKAILGTLFGSIWEYCHIWVNPPDERERIIHTINLAHRHPPEIPTAIPVRALKFAKGLWKLE
jgi:hypothetical protein